VTAIFWRLAFYTGHREREILGPVGAFEPTACGPFRTKVTSRNSSGWQAGQALLRELPLSSHTPFVCSGPAVCGPPYNPQDRRQGARTLQAWASGSTTSGGPRQCLGEIESTKAHLAHPEPLNRVDDRAMTARAATHTRPAASSAQLPASVVTLKRVRRRSLLALHALRHGLMMTYRRLAVDFRTRRSRPFCGPLHSGAPMVRVLAARTQDPRSLGDGAFGDDSRTLPYLNTCPDESCDGGSSGLRKAEIGPSSSQKTHSASGIHDGIPSWSSHNDSRSAARALCRVRLQRGLAA